MYSQINPFFARRGNVTPSKQVAQPTRAIYAKLPSAPINASPVPHLTSLYHNSRAGEYGDRRYPGNCGGNLIKDLLLYFRPGLVFDPMAGSGTCRDVCDELGIPCLSWDIHNGFDACDPVAFSASEAFDFIWAHPAYWRQKLYADDSRDLSRAPTLHDFLRRYAQFIRNCAKALKPNGKLAILMGDYCDREAGFVPLTYHTKRLAFEAGLSQTCTDIIRFSHGASSSRKVYRSSFIPGLHDTCMVFEKSSKGVTA
jgi:SAM-dependent methyltransferase